MMWQKDWPISWEPGNVVLRSLLHLKALAEQVLLIPYGPHLPPPSSPNSASLIFSYLDDISGTAAPFRSILRALDSPRRDLSNAPKDLGDPFSGSPSGLVTTTCSPSPLCQLNIPFPWAHPGLVLLRIHPLSSLPLALLPPAVVLSSDSGTLVKTVCLVFPSVSWHGFFPTLSW